MARICAFLFGPGQQQSGYERGETKRASFRRAGQEANEGSEASDGRGSFNCFHVDVGNFA